MRTNYTIGRISWSLLTGIILLIMGCSKNERVVEDRRFASLQFRGLTVDSFRLKLTANQQMLTDNLSVPGPAFTPRVSYFDPTHRIQATDLISQRLLLDTTIDFKPGPIMPVTLFQPASGAPLRMVSPSRDETLPPPGKYKLSVIYTFPEMPARTKVVVGNETESQPGSFIPTDSFYLNKREFSPFFLRNRDRQVITAVRFYSADDQRKWIAASRITFYQISNADLSMYVFQVREDFSPGVINLTSERIY